MILYNTFLMQNDELRVLFYSRRDRMGGSADKKKRFFYFIGGNSQKNVYLCIKKFSDNENKRGCSDP